MALPKPPETLLWTEREKLPLWCPPGRFAVPRFQQEREELRRRQAGEYRRLLYVALTRAEDRLYICGWQTRRKPDAGCWYELCRAGLAGVATPFSFDATPLLEADRWCGEGLRVEGEQTVLPVREDDPGAVRPAGPLPGWATRPPPAEPEPPRPLVPSRPSEAEPPALSPLATAGRDRFKRGLLVHRLLQSLAELPAAERDSAARGFLSLPAHRLPEEAQDEIRRETLAVLDHPDFAPLFGPGSQAEVPLVGLIGGHAVSGQIDRLVVAGNRVLIVDYKTLRPPPATEAEVAPVYLRQLAVYSAALERIYPGRDIRCALLWTEGPRLMPVSPERLASYLP
jgi:ATP-dependent helicase/nuclease subunit A